MFGVDHQLIYVQVTNSTVVKEMLLLVVTSSTQFKVLVLEQ